MVGDELVGPLADPRQIADAELASLAQGERDLQARRIAEGLRPLGRRAQSLGLEPGGTHRLGLREVEAEQLTAIGNAHAHILTNVRTSLGCLP